MPGSLIVGLSLLVLFAGILSGFAGGPEHPRTPCNLHVYTGSAVIDATMGNQDGDHYRFITTDGRAGVVYGSYAIVLEEKIK